MQLKINNKIIYIKEAKSFNERLLGLMGQKNIKNGMLFDRCNAIHTYFMKEPIDVLALNKNNKVISKITLEKNKFFRVKHPLNETKILELPKGYASKIKIGSIIKFLLI